MAVERGGAISSEPLGHQPSTERLTSYYLTPTNNNIIYIYLLYVNK